MCLYDSDCYSIGLDTCCDESYCCGSSYPYYTYSTWGTGSIVGVVIGLIFFKIFIISCIVYYRRRRTAIPYMVAPNTHTVATVVQTNQQVAGQQYVQQPYYPASQPMAQSQTQVTAQVNTSVCKPPAYSEVVPVPV